MKKIIVSSLLLISVFLADAQKGTIKGTVTDAKTNEVLIGTTVMLKGTTTGGITDFDGNYTIPKINPGRYTLLVSFISYDSKEMPIEVKAGEEKVINVSLSPATIEVEGVRVVAKANRESEAMLLIDQKKSENIKESIGAKRLSELGVSDAASATSKISGVTKNEGSGDVYIRGLGDRYLSTTMNGLPIPSDDVEKKNIDLGLFSTDVIKNVSISKTYDAATYGDQSSGAVDISSKSYSEKFELEVKAGSNTNVFSDGMFGNFKGTQNLNDLTMGFYKSPMSIEDALQNQSWNTVDVAFPLDRSFSISGGKKAKLGTGDLSMFGVLSYGNEYDYSEGVYQKYRANDQYKSFTDLEKFETIQKTTALLSFDYEINKDNSISYHGVLLNKAKDELWEMGRNGEGFFYDQIPQEEETFIRDQNIKQNLLFVNQLLGDHKLNKKNNLKWAVGYNRVKADEPNRIGNQVIMLEEDEIYFVKSTNYEHSKSCQEIKDNEVNGYLKNITTLIDEEDKKLKLNYGLNFRYKTRDFSSQKVASYLPSPSATLGTSIDKLDEILNNGTYYDNSTIRTKIAQEDTYDASLLVGAGYLNATYNKNKFMVNVGVRYEYDLINVDWDVANYVGRTGDLEGTYDNILPSLNLKYSLGDKNILRLAASKTVTLPEFKELAPFEYVSPTGQVQKGNPDLINSNDYNIDVKWELFPTAKEMISLTGFYKLIEDPINLAQARGSSGNFYFANTGEKANVYGIELEAKVGIIKTEGTGKPDLNLSMNLTKMWFEQDLLEEFQYYDKTTSGLQGAAGFITNGSLIFSTNTENELVATVTGNYSSDKILVLGAPEDQSSKDTEFNSEIIEKGFATVDLILSKQLSKRFQLKLSCKNLLDPTVEYTQEVVPRSTSVARTEVVESHKKGVSFSLGLKVNLNK